MIAATPIRTPAIIPTIMPVSELELELLSCDASNCGQSNFFGNKSQKYASVMPELHATHAALDVFVQQVAEEVELEEVDPPELVLEVSCVL